MAYYIKKRLVVKKRSKRMNDKRCCGFCKVTFPSQRTYNGHVNTCKEVRS